LDSGLEIPVPDKEEVDLVQDQTVVLGIRAEEITPVNTNNKLSEN
jgi:hypothetical protein